MSGYRITIIRYGISLSFLMIPLLVKGQGINNNMRSMDNNHFLATDSSDLKFFRNIKEIPFHKNGNPASLSFGGEIRQQVRAYNNLLYGDAVPDQDAFLLQRYMMHSDFLINKTFRIFGQLNSTHVKGKNSIGANDRDKLGVMQAFIDINFPAGPFRIRLGRQEMAFGSERILGIREGPNNRMSYTGIRTTFKIKGATGDILFVNPPVYNPGFLDNEINFRSRIFGNYWSIPFRNGFTADLYFMGNVKKDSRVLDFTAVEKRYSLGARLNKSGGTFYYDAEATWQTGSFDSRHIAAWQLTGFTGYGWRNNRLSPRVQVKASIYSGDKDSTDKSLNIFKAIAAKPPVNDMLPVGPTNMILVVPEGEIKVSGKVGLSLRYFAIWRFRNSDGLYSTDMERMTRPADSEGVSYGKYAAGGPSFEFSYTARKHFSCTLTTGTFIPGTYVKNTSKGETLQGIIAKAYYRF